MTDYDDELREMREKVFGPPGETPPTRPGNPVTLEQVIEFSHNWQRRRGRTDADIVTDPDGMPIGVGESFIVTCAGWYISQADADRLGISEGQLPGIRIIPKPKPRRKAQ